MTNEEKQLLTDYREAGLGYAQISKMMNIPIGSIKTFCRRHNLGGSRATQIETGIVAACEQCGKPVKQNAGRKAKRFCSDKCRMLWWNTHTAIVNKKANYSFVCANCGKPFISYGNKNRKYCSHSCYIEDRFGGGC